MSYFENITLLYIDDDVDIRHKYALLIAENGFKVLEAASLCAAYDFITAHKIDCILMDIILPNENGLDFIRSLRQKELLIPIVITTSILDQTILLDAINLDITRYLIKPLSDNDLFEALYFVTKKLFMRAPVNFTYLEGGYYYDPINKSFNDHDGKTTALSKKEYRLMELLLSNKESTVPYSAIENTVWQGSYMSMAALRTLVRGIRKKTHHSVILNHNGAGYRINLN